MLKVDCRQTNVCGYRKVQPFFVDEYDEMIACSSVFEEERVGPGKIAGLG
jgi:hypothetical protein